jgi:HD-like signal output (HDOD) protein
MTTSDKSIQELIVEAISTHELQLPVINPVALRLQKALHQEDIKIGAIEAMVVEDQTLASQILRVANAAFYRGLQPVVTIRKAIIRLGLERVVNLAMLVAQQSLYRTIGGVFAGYMIKMWQHAFACAMGCKWVAERCGYRSEADTAFLAGLLHNIGQLAVLKILEDLHNKKTLSVILPESLVIEILTGEMHTQQGYALLEQWNLPEEYRVVVRDHHLENYNTNNVLLAIVRLVDQACEKNAIGLGNDPQIALAATPEAQHLGLSDVALAELEIMLEDSVNTTQQF